MVLNFYVYTRTSIHCLYFIYARTNYATVEIHLEGRALCIWWVQFFILLSVLFFFQFFVYVLHINKQKCKNHDHFGSKVIVLLSNLKLKGSYPGKNTTNGKRLADVWHCQQSLSIACSILKYPRTTLHESSKITVEHALHVARIQFRTQA